MTLKSIAILLACLIILGAVHYFIDHNKLLENSAKKNLTSQPEIIQIKSKNQIVLGKLQSRKLSGKPKDPSQDLFAEYEALAKDNLRRALERAKTLTGDNRTRAISAVFSVALVTNPEFIAKEVLAAELPENQVEILLNQLDMAWPNPKTGLEWVEQNLVGELGQASRSRLLKRLAEISPDEALKYLTKMSPGAEYDASYISVLLGWVQLDPAGAIDYAENAPGKLDFASILTLLSTPWIERDSASVKAFLEKHLDDADAVGLAAKLAAHLARTDPESTLKWTANLTGVAGEEFQRFYVRELVQEDTKNAASIIENAEISVRMKLAPKLIATWSAMDIVAAEGWLSKLPPSEQIPMVGPLLWNWINIDPLAASGWISGLDAGPLKEKAVFFFEEMEMQINGSPGKKTMEVQQIISSAIQDQDIEFKQSPIKCDCGFHTFPNR
jgi:hypothetical protein